MTTNAHDDNAARMFRSGHYNAYDGKGWQKCAEGLPVKESLCRDVQARANEDNRRIVAGLQSQPATAGTVRAHPGVVVEGIRHFVVGQTISTLEEYEAFPVGGTLWTQNRTSHWKRCDDSVWSGYTLAFIAGAPFGDDDESSLRTVREMVGVPRTVRSLP